MVLQLSTEKYFVWVLLLTMFFLCTSQNQQLINLRLGYAHQPAFLEYPTPKFTWQLGMLEQSSDQIQIEKKRSDLEGEENLVGDSRKVQSSEKN